MIKKLLSRILFLGTVLFFMSPIVAKLSGNYWYIMYSFIGLVLVYIADKFKRYRS